MENGKELKKQPSSPRETFQFDYFLEKKKNLTYSYLEKQRLLKILTSEEKH